VDALRQAGDLARGATVYVTLEPCSHHGRSPPCADALIAAGVSRVVSAIEDPNPLVNGQGHARLRAAGIAVEVGEGAAEAAEINAGFLLRVREGRPLIHLKLATSLDGRVATASGESQWITGPEARAWGHRMRATHEAILVGASTVAQDDPELTCRLPGLARYSPIRVVLDSRVRLSPTSRLATTARTLPVWLVCTPAAPVAKREALQALGVEIIEVAADPAGRVDVAAAVRALAARGIMRLMVEGGGAVAAAFLKAGEVDRLSIFRAGLALGGDSRSAVGPLALERLGSAPRFTLVSTRKVGADTLETWRREP
ncbi:MAG: riboflavin biosynthesis protein RibD, partial [Brevundimonas sp. 67-6]